MENQKLEINVCQGRPVESLQKKSLRYIGFPVLLGVIATALGYDAALLAYPGLLAVVMVGWLLERIIPYETDRWIEPGALKLNTAFNIATLLVGPALGVLISWTISRIEIPGVNISSWSFVLQLPLALVVSGLLPYFLHRLAHENDGFLWRAHSIHHAPRSVYWFNALRLHPVNTAWNTASGLIPLLILGFDPEIVFMTGVLNNFMSIVNHLNADLKLGPLNLIFNSGQLHRWHHNRNLDFANHKFSNGLLIFWDLVLGTYRLPRRRQESSEVGLSDETDFPLDSVKEQLLYPFRRADCCENPGLAA